MRTTLAIDDDVLTFARSIAERERSSIGDALSTLAREGMIGRSNRTSSRASFPTLPKRGVVVTLEMVNALRDEE